MKPRWSCAICGAVGRISTDPAKDWAAHYLEAHWVKP